MPDGADKKNKKKLVETASASQAGAPDAAAASGHVGGGVGLRPYSVASKTIRFCYQYIYPTSSKTQSFTNNYIIWISS